MGLHDDLGYPVSMEEAVVDYVDIVDLQGWPNLIDPSWLCRLPPNDIQALSGYRLSIIKCFIGQLAKSCSNHDPELEVSSAEETIQDAKKFEQ
uniref:Uncharacterized protein n=1 Tax=Tanacetum cinerariifolium TaxID=118510 RepID=A0A699SU68_TANCI|nr:hypothetical protein [Tanacetum cinerariifolium]